MPVMNTKGELFDERRKTTRRCENIEVETERREGDRRVKDINASTKKRRFF